MEKNNEVFRQFMETQKNMFGMWQKMAEMSFAPKNQGEGAQPGKDFMDYFKEFYELNQKYFAGYSGDPTQLYQRINESQETYQKMFKLWYELNKEGFSSTSEKINEVQEEWYKEYTRQIKENYVSYLPEPLRKLVEDSAKLMESYREASIKFWKPWFDDTLIPNEEFFKGDFYNPGMYLQQLKNWKDNYEKSFGKIMDLPATGFNREHLVKQSESFDKYIQFGMLVNEVLANIYKIGQETIQKVIDDNVKMYEAGKKIENFEEFYEYWVKEISSALDKMHFSKDFSALMGQALKAMTDLKIEADKLWEDYLSYYPIPKKSDMDSLYKTVYKMKRELTALRKEISELKGQKPESGN